MHENKKLNFDFIIQGSIIKSKFSFLFSTGLGWQPAASGE
jgi:hypothetical protein